MSIWVLKENIINIDNIIYNQKKLFSLMNVFCFRTTAMMNRSRFDGRTIDVRLY